MDEKHLITRTRVAFQPIIELLNAEFQEEDEEFESNYSFQQDQYRLQVVLRNLVDSWIASSFNFTNWRKANPELRKKLDDYTSNLRCKLEPDDDGRAILKTEIIPKSYDVVVVADFVRLIRSPLFNRIGKCKRCKNYYLAESAHETKYCSRECARGATAVAATKKRLQRQRQEKIIRTRKAIHEFKKRAPKNKDWKLWVAKRAGVTPKWITQAFNRGELPNARELGSRKRR